MTLSSHLVLKRLYMHSALLRRDQSAARCLYGLKTLRAHGLTGKSLYDVTGICQYSYDIVSWFEAFLFSEFAQRIYPADQLNHPASYA